MKSLQVNFCHSTPTYRACVFPGTATLTRALSLTLMIALSALSVTDAVAASAQSSHNWRFHGRFQLDGAQYDSTNPLFVDDAGVRRGRISFSGDLFDRLSMKMEYELSGSTPGPKSMYFRQKLGKKSLLTVGHFKMPVSLQTATSSRYNTFMERSLPNVGTTGYRLGAMASTYGKFWSASSGITSGKLSDKYDVSNDGIGFFARGVLNPVRSKDSLVHIGLGTEVRRYGQSDSVQFRSRPESDLTDLRMVDTLDIFDLDQSFRYTAEFAWKLRSLQLQAEYMGTSITRRNGLDLDFDGWYAQAGWFITGESRRYNRRKGSFRRTKPDHSFGALEVAVRYSELDLNSADIAGGAESNTGLALNWYATDSVRVSLNYIEASARPDSLGLNDDVSVIQGRFQFIF